MTASDRETFLEQPHVAVLAIARADGEPPLVSPVWYDYQRGGDVIVTIGVDSEKAKRLAVSPVASVCVQTTELPYRFVTVSGPVTLGPADSGIRRRIAAALPAAGVGRRVPRRRGGRSTDTHRAIDARELAVQRLQQDGLTPPLSV